MTRDGGRPGTAVGAVPETKGRKPMDAVDVLRGAKELLLNDGWIQGHYHRSPYAEGGGGYCLLGAVSCAAGELPGRSGAVYGPPAARMAHAALELAVPPDHPAFGRCQCSDPDCPIEIRPASVPEAFSEHAHTTVDDVIALIDRALAVLAWVPEKVDADLASAPPPGGGVAVGRVGPGSRVLVRDAERTLTLA